MRSSDRISGRRYARALLDVAASRDLADVVGRDLENVAAIYLAHPELASALRHPAIPAEQKKTVVARIFQGAVPLFLRLLDRLIERRRIELLPVVAREYKVLHNRSKGVVAAEAVFAVEPTASEVESLGRALSDTLGQKIDLKTLVDPSIQGGVLVRAEGWVFDGTIRARLGALRERLRGASPA